MNKAILTGLAAIAAAGLGCANVHDNLEPIKIPLNGCELVQPCGVVCYERLDNGNAVIKLNGNAYSPTDVMVNCMLESMFATDKMIYLHKAEKQ